MDHEPKYQGKVVQIKITGMSKYYPNPIGKLYENGKVVDPRIVIIDTEKRMPRNEIIKAEIKLDAPTYLLAQLCESV